MTRGILGFSIIKQSKDRGFIAINQKKGKDWMRGKNGVHERQNPPQNHKKDQVLEAFQLTVLLLRFLAQIRWHRARFLQLRVSIRRRD